jgi:hypothetical protein
VTRTLTVEVIDNVNAARLVRPKTIEVGPDRCGIVVEIVDGRQVRATLTAEQDSGTARDVAARLEDLLGSYGGPDDPVLVEAYDVRLAVRLLRQAYAPIRRSAD